MGGGAQGRGGDPAAGVRVACRAPRPDRRGRSVSLAWAPAGLPRAARIGARGGSERAGGGGPPGGGKPEVAQGGGVGGGGEGGPPPPPPPPPPRAGRRG